MSKITPGFPKSVGHVGHVRRNLKMSDDKLLDRQTKCPAKIFGSTRSTEKYNHLKWGVKCHLNRLET